MQDHKTNLLQNVDKIEQDGVLNKDAVGLYADILNFQSETNTKWKALDPFPQIKTELPLGPGSLDLDSAAKDILKGSLEEICSVIKVHNPDLDFSGVKAAVNGDDSFIDTLINSVLGKDTDALNAMALSAKMGFEEYLFLMVNWLKPLFTALCERHDGTDSLEYRERTCPFCGYYPDMGILSAEKEGKRFLRCGLCENIWLYRRLACAICGERKADKLEYFMLEENKRYRVDACNSCKGYIKSVCLEKFDELDSCDLTVENLLTMSLDAEMMNKGYGKL